MTDDDYVAELRGHGMLSTNQAADRIEQLTAERDGLLRCVTDNHVALCRAEKAEAERDRLTAIGNEMAESIEGNYYLPGVATRWFAALKGETP